MIKDDLKFWIFSLVTAIGSIYLLFRPEPKNGQDESKPQVPSEGGLGVGRELFEPTDEWQPVGDDQICPAGLEYRMNLSDGTKFARKLQS